MVILYLAVAIAATLIRANNDTSDMTCPLPSVNNTHMKVASDKLMGTLEYHCYGCFGNSGGELKRYCTENGTWVGDFHAVCTETCHDTVYKGWCSRLNRRHKSCVFDPGNFWSQCAKTCDVGALCHRDTGERDCQCGDYAKKGLCETDQDTRDRCPHTCHKRKTTSCGPPPEQKFTVADGNGTQYLDVVTLTCLPGYISLTVSKSVYGCDRFGHWVATFRSEKTFCVPLRPASESAYFPQITTVFKQHIVPDTGLNLRYLAHTSQTTIRDCLDQCRLLTRCSHVMLDEQMENCTTMGLQTGEPRVTVLHGVVWKKWN